MIHVNEVLVHRSIDPRRPPTQPRAPKSRRPAPTARHVACDMSRAPEERRASRRQPPGAQLQRGPSPGQPGRLGPRSRSVSVSSTVRTPTARRGREHDSTRDPPQVARRLPGRAPGLAAPWRQLLMGDATPAAVDSTLYRCLISLSASRERWLGIPTAQGVGPRRKGTNKQTARTLRASGSGTFWSCTQVSLNRCCGQYHGRASKLSQMAACGFHHFQVLGALRS